MIKIEAWFPKEIREEYLNKLLFKLRMKEDDEIRFLPGKTIALRTLLIGTREEVFKVDGIQEYLGIFQCTIKRSGYTQADYLSQLNRAFPKDVKCETRADALIYSLNSISVQVSKDNTLRRIVKGDMSHFFAYYLSKLGIVSKGSYTFSIFLKTAAVEIKKIQSIVTKKIDYKIIDSELRHKLLSSFHIKCCPYCNRQYITVWNDEKNKPHSTADFDHFYPKDTYPLFALSLFNFVPSCQICNSRMKGSKTIATLYPYEEGMDEFRFHCVPKQENPDSLVDLWLANKNSYPNDILDKYVLKLLDESCNDSNKNDEEFAHFERIHGSIEMFHLEEVYQTHLEAAINEILKIRIYFSGDYAKYAEKTLKDIGILNQKYDVETKQQFSIEEMRDIILGFVYSGQNIMDQPLGKMLSDIFENEMAIRHINHHK